MRVLFYIILLFAFLPLLACKQEAAIRIENLSASTYKQVLIGDQDFGEIASGEISPYKAVKLQAGYVVIKIRIENKTITGQSLNFGADKFTYQIDIVDMDAGHLKIEVLRDPS